MRRGYFLNFIIMQADKTQKPVYYTFFFHTLYIILLKMKNDTNIRNFIEISGNMHGKSRKMHGKSGNFRGIHSSK